MVFKAWRNPAKAGTKVVLVGRALSIDREGFLPELLEPEEVAKLARLPGWRYVDRDGSEVQAMRLAELSQHRDDIKARLDRELVIVNDLQRRYAEVEERIAQIGRDAEEAALRAEAEKKAAEVIDLDGLNMNELRVLAAQRGIVVDPRERSREKVVAALRSVVNQVGDGAGKAVGGEG